MISKVQRWNNRLDNVKFIKGTLWTMKNQKSLLLGINIINMDFDPIFKGQSETSIFPSNLRIKATLTITLLESTVC